jgi:hypothetical protein
MKKFTDVNKYSKKRRHIRYRPDVNSISLIEFIPTQNKFKADTSALTFEESFSGCCVILFAEQAPVLEDIWRLRVGDLSPLLAEVAWIKTLDECVYKVGLKYLQ